MQVSKWDLIVFTQLQSFEVKLIMQMLTGEKEPTLVGIHHVMFSLILSRENWSISRKIRRLIAAVSFILEEGNIQESEA
jgi:hypothetical protein